MPSDETLQNGRLVRTVFLRTPGKININLQILRKRADGYHELRLDFIPIDLFDCLALQPLQDSPDELCRRGFVLPDADNLICRAQTAFLAAAQAPAVRFLVRKTIPIGAGLGGGSSDAAAVLWSLNRLAGSPLPAAELHQIAGTLGSDVPFFLKPIPSFGSGRGERLSPLPPQAIKNRLYFVLVVPEFSISTAAAFRSCQVQPPFAPCNALTPEYSFDSLCQFPPTCNAFWSERLPYFTDLQRIRGHILQLAPQRVGAVFLSGSGSSLLALVVDQLAQQEVHSILSEHYRVHSVKSLQRFEHRFEESCL